MTGIFVLITLCAAFDFFADSIHICMCNLKALDMNIKGDFFKSKLCSTYSGFIFIFILEGFYISTPQIQTV